MITASESVASSGACHQFDKTESPEPATVVDHFDMIPKTPHSARKCSKPVVYFDDSVKLPSSDVVECPELNQAAPHVEQQEPGQAKLQEEQQLKKKESVFDRLYHLKGEPAPRRHVPVTTRSPAVNPAVHPPVCHSKRPLTVPQGPHFRTDDRIAMKHSVMVFNNKTNDEVFLVCIISTNH